MSKSDKYAQLDAKLLELIKSGIGAFGNLTVRRDVMELTVPHETSTTESWRIVDRRLQALRKAGKIAFCRNMARWEVV